MNPITLPYHLLIPSLISIILIVIIVFKWKTLITQGRNKWLWIALIIFFGSYGLLNLLGVFDDIYAQWDLNRYDLDQDGFFAGDELTFEQEEAMNRLIWDTGRNFLFIIGFFDSLILTVIIVPIMYIMKRLVGRLKKGKL